MTPKEQYEERKRIRKARQMAQQDEWERKKQREQLADEAITVMLDGLRAFFSGKATLHIGPMQPGMGQPIRFYKDPT